MNSENFEILNPEFLWLLLIIPVLAVYFFVKRKDRSAYINVSDTSALKNVSDPVTKMRPILYVLRLLVLAFLILGLSRPRYVDVSTKTRSAMGIDIVMAVDISASMLAKDLKPNRLDALKNVAEEFVNGRSGDRIGMVAYAGESFTQCPLTTDHKVVRQAVRDLNYGMLDGGTAIGMGLGTAVNRLKDSKAKSKVIILLTDGVNTDGFVDPKTAAEIAADMNIKVYTVGIGTNGMAPTPYSIDPFDGTLMYRRMPVEIDEDLLKEIAQMTKGRYFRATDNEKLEEIYKEIDQLEKTKIQELKYYNYEEKFRPLVVWALLLFALELLLRHTLFRSFL